MLYTCEELINLMQYLSARYPVLKGTRAMFTQDLGKDGKNRSKIGVYKENEDLIILLDVPILDSKMHNILAHEAAHAINFKRNGIKGHGKKWTEICNDIYIKTGILPIDSEMNLNDDSNFSIYDDLRKAYKCYSPDYTSTKIEETDDDTLIYIKRHKARIKFWMQNFSNYLLMRADAHDASKLQEPEISMWREMDKEPRHPYSEDPESPYQQKLKKYFPVFEEHWKHNRHHIEFYKYNENDFGLDLIDLVELICDQLLGYKYEIGYSKAMAECRRLGKKYGKDEVTGKDGPLTEEIISLMENTIRNYFVVFADQSPVVELKRSNVSGSTIDIFV